MLENIVAYHCGPALAGIKPANIAACPKSKMPDAKAEIDKLNGELNKRDIYIKILCECEKRVLIMVYRKNVLEKHLQRGDMREFLKDYGYPQQAELEEYISYLRTRLKANEFPHEIGVFLGYPLHDIFGFIHHKDEGCLLVGDWKVYKDAEGAEKLFSRYKACRNGIKRRMLHGFSLAQIFCAA